MDRLVYGRWWQWNELSRMPASLLARKFECTFYLLFCILACICLVLPFKIGIKAAPLLATGAFSLFYCILMWFYRYRIYVHFGLMIHTGIFLVFSSMVLFETQVFVLGTIFIVLGILSISMVLVLCSHGCKVFVENDGPGLRLLNEPRQQANVPRHMLHANGHAIPILEDANEVANAVQANGHADLQRDEPQVLVEEAPDLRVRPFEEGIIY